MTNRVRPLRIAQVVGALDRGGTETWLRDVVRHLDRARFSIDFVVHEEREYAYEREIVRGGGRVLRCPRPERPWSHFLALRELFRTHGPYDLVHSHLHHYSGIVLMAAAAAGVPRRIAHSHTTGATLHRTPLGWAYRAAMSAVLRRVATGGLAASRLAAGDLFGRGWRDDSRWRVLHCGIDLGRFGAVSTGEVRQKLGIERSALVMGHVGRFAPEKNHEFLLAVAREVMRRRPGAMLLLVGDGPRRAAIEVAASDLGIRDDVHFLGLRADVPDLLAAIDAFVFPSVWEGLPLAVLEAQAAGVPSVISAEITDEVAVAPRLVHPMSLNAPPSVWAEAVLGLPRPTDESRARALGDVRGSTFDIQVSANALASYFAGG